MTEHELAYLRAVAAWRQSLTPETCHDLHSEYQAGSQDPAAIDGHHEYLTRTATIGGGTA